MRSEMLAALVVVLACCPAWADSMDDAEAKRRGVPVEAVQLEAARAKIAALQEQLAKLQKENAELKAKTAQAQNVTASPPAPPVTPAIAEGIKNHKLVIGMTFDQAKKALAGVPGTWEPRLASETADAQIYEWALWSTKEERVGGKLVVTPDARIGSLMGMFVDGKLAQIDNR